MTTTTNSRKCLIVRPVVIVTHGILLWWLVAHGAMVAGCLDVIYVPAPPTATARIEHMSQEEVTKSAHDQTPVSVSC